MSRALHNPLVVFLMLFAIDGLILSSSQRNFPPTIASHFDLQGNAVGELETKTLAMIFALLSAGVPLLIVGIVHLAQHLPTRLIKLPNRDYWLAPERRTSTFAVLLLQSVWLAILALVTIMGLYFLILVANFSHPERLSIPATLVLLGGFVLGVAYWVVLQFRRLRKVE